MTNIVYFDTRIVIEVPESVTANEEQQAVIDDAIEEMTEKITNVLLDMEQQTKGLKATMSDP